MARGTPFRFSRFGRGWNTTDGPYQLREGVEDDPSGLGAETSDCLNVVPGERGGIRSRDGSSQLQARADIKSISTVRGGGSASVLIYNTGNGDQYTLSSGVETLLGNFGALAPWTFIQGAVIAAEGPFYGMNGLNTPAETDGAAGGLNQWNITGQTALNGQHLVAAGNRAWVAGQASDRYAVSFSDIGNFTNFPVENIVRFSPNGGEPITALAAVGSYVLVFTAHSITVIYDLDTGANRLLTSTAGTLSPRSVVVDGDTCYFLDPDNGVMTTDGTDTRRISRQIQSTLATVLRADLPSAVAAFHRNHYYLSLSIPVNGVPSATRTLLDYHAELGSWWRHSLDVAVLARWDNGTDVFLVGAAPTRLVRLFDPAAFADVGLSYTSKWRSPWHDLGSAHARKRVRRLQIDGSSRCIVRTYADRDEAAVVFLSPTVNLDTGPGDPGQGRILNALGVCRAFQVEFLNTGTFRLDVDAYTILADRRQD